MRRRIEVADSASEIAGKVVFGNPKTHQARFGPIPRFLVEDLGFRLANKESDDLVSTAPQGGVLRLQSFRHGHFNRAAATAGLFDDDLDAVADALDRAARKPHVSKMFPQRDQRSS